MSEPSDTRRPSTARTSSPETQRLGALVGRWRSEGHIVGDRPVPITGTDTYEWLGRYGNGGREWQPVGYARRRLPQPRLLRMAYRQSLPAGDDVPAASRHDRR